MSTVLRVSPAAPPLLAVSLTGPQKRLLALVDATGRIHQPTDPTTDDGPTPRGRAGHLRVPVETVAAVRAGRVKGSQAVISGQVTFDGDWADLLAWAGASLATPGLLTESPIDLLTESPIDQLTEPTIDQPASTTDTTRPARPAGPQAATAVPAVGGAPATSTARVVVAVLGAPNDDQGKLSAVAADRVRFATRLLEVLPDAQLVLVGGNGPQFNTTDRPHWAHCRTFLASQNLTHLPVLACLDSRHTYEDLLLLREVVHRHDIGQVLVVTSDYHLPRTRHLADLVLPTAVVHGVRHATLSPTELARLRAHERTTLGRVIAAALLFGPDTLRQAPATTDLDGTTRFTPVD